MDSKKRKHGSLRQSADQFIQFVADVKDYAIFMLDPSGHVISWNAGAERIKGYKATEIIGQHFSRFYPEEAVARGWPEHELVVAGKEGRFEDEGWRLRKDGSQFWANVVITALYDEQRNLRGFLKVTRDLTERRRMEEELRGRLDELKEADRRKDEFLAMLAHELRNPLSPIRNGLHILRLAQQRGGVDTEQILQVMDKQLHVITRLIDDLLDVSRVTRGRIQLHKERLELADAVNHAVEGVRPLVEARQQTLTIVLPPEAILLEADPTRLEQVIANLLNNATKYTPPGGFITLAAERIGSEAVVRVQDSGVGISADLLPHIFELFTQSERGLDRAEGGLGIGLTMVKKIVELHGGRVEAISEGRGKGSEFIVRLPALNPLSCAVDHPDLASADHSSERSLRGLVVEDVAQTAQSFAMLLGAWGYESRIVHDGPAALVAFRTYQPDVVLLDIGLPGMNGYDVARVMRQQSSERRPLIVAVTGYSRDEDRNRSEKSGIDFHMTKPVDPAALERLLTGFARAVPA